MLGPSRVGTPTGSPEPPGQSCTFRPKPSLGGRGPSSPNGPNRRLRGSDAASFGAPLGADPRAGGARL
eukprot:1275448-Alexandrium_andersonii.AAC.1